MLVMNEMWRITHQCFFAFYCFNWKRSALLAWHSFDLVWSRFHLPTNPVRKLVLRLNLFFENLKLIYPITVYRLHELTSSPNKINYSSSGYSCSGWFSLARDGLDSFLFFAIFFSVSWALALGIMVVKKKDTRLKPYKACSLGGTRVE